jgi:uncharacterized protein YycO
METFRRYLIRVLKPLCVYLGRLHYPPHSRLIRSTMIKEMLDVVMAGDVVITYSRGEMTNRFIKGEFKHAAIYAGAGKVIQAVGKGVTADEFEDFCASKDRIAIVRPKFCDDSTCKIAALNAISQLGKPYDYYFEIGDGAFYCAELIEWAYRQATSGASPFTKKDAMGVETVLPSDFYLAKSKFALVIERPLT